MKWLKELFKSSKRKERKKIKMILKSEDIKNYPHIFNQEEMEFDKYNRFDMVNGFSYYEDKDGNVYKDKEGYLTETREQKLNQLLNGSI